MVVQEATRFEKETKPETITHVVGGYKDVTVGEVALTGSLAESIAGIGAVVLTIIGLANILAGWLLPIATIAAGVGLMFEGGAVAARFSRLIDKFSGSAKGYVTGGLTVEFLAGFVGVVLGILSLLSFVPLVLVAVAAITYGAALVLGSGVTGRLHSLVIEQHGEHEFAHHVAREAAWAAAGVQILIGSGVIVLGILSLTGIVPLLLGLVSILAIGFYVFLSGTAFCNGLVSVFYR